MPLRKTSPYRLLACDLDGTLMGDDTNIGVSVRQAITTAQDLGVLVTLATGRGFPETLPFAHLLNITVPIICFQGGLIKHPLTYDAVFRATMDRGLVLDVIQLAHTRDWHLLLYIDDGVFLEEMRRHRRFYDVLLGKNIHCVDDLTRVAAHHDSQPAKFLVVGSDGAESDNIQEVLRAHFGHQMQVVRSHTLFVEGNPIGVDKGDALRRLSAHLNVPQTHVMAIGDQGNDVPMLAWAGFGVAMGNGSDAAKAVSDWTAPPLSAAGAAVAIERFLLAVPIDDCR
jgi:Cof subfamily protein (haloacid dehalogenase superfamily)